MFKLFKKKRKHMLFGRLHDGSRSTCDVCGKIVGFSDYIYLCRECHDKLPKKIQAVHNILVHDKEARLVFFNKGIEFFNETGK